MNRDDEGDDTDTDDTEDLVKSAVERLILDDFALICRICEIDEIRFEQTE